ncbi:MAG: hypothetical protein DSZ33_05875 [Gammaproteobacteria bacterium]|nr:MAG: hypothetical protein DSZ33_05875 [Gammaproteobacteria bacterium]
MSDPFNPESELWLALHLPLLGLDLLQLSSAHVPAACVYAGENRHQHIYQANSRALRCGVTPGMALKAALAQYPGLQTYPRRAEAEQERLEKLALICLDYSSRISLEPPQALLLEVGASARLWQAQFLRRHLQTLLGEQGHIVHAALHETPTGALLLARGRVDKLDALPLSAFPVEADIIQKLTRIGVRNLRDYQHLPEKDRILRFGLKLEQIAQKALGQIPDPHKNWNPPFRFRHTLDLEYETDNAGQLLFCARRLLDELDAVLAQTCSAVQKLHWLFHHYQQPATRHTQQLLHPGRDMSHISLLLREQLERLPLPASVEKITLQVNRFWPNAADNLNLLRDMGQNIDAIEPLLEKLQARLGRQAVYQLCALPDHRPENAWSRVIPGQSSPPPESLPPRPLWLLPQPRKLTSIRPFRHWRGPERIASGWWEDDVQRDYYRARHHNGVTFWLYRHADNWFIHGVFG